MPPKLLVDYEEINLEDVEYGIEEIRKFNQQRYEMEQLTGIIRFAPEHKYVVGFKAVTNKEFWIRGHVPGRPLMPGVVMCEAAAQLCSFYYLKALPEFHNQFLGFGGMRDVKFRGTVVPGDRLILAAKCTEMKTRRATFLTQGLVNDKVIFEATIIGMPV